MLSGKKTFLMALAAVCYAIGGYLTGNIDGPHAIELVLGSGLAAALRDAIRTKPTERTMPDRPGEYRDDTALSGTGPLTQSLDNWQLLHVAADTPLPYEVQIEQLHAQAVIAYERGDTAAVMDAVRKMSALRHRNTNSGAVAPIQGQD